MRVDIIDYPAFIFSGLLPWTWFSSCLSASGHLFFTHRDLLRRPAFPPETLIVVNTLTHLTTFFLSLPLLWALMIWHGRFIVWNPFLLLLLLSIQAILIIGLSLLIATVNVFYRDIAHLVGIVLSLLFFLTPIFYRPIVESQYDRLIALNPLVPLINSYRAVLFEGTLPDIGSLILVGTVSLAVCAIGLLTYKRLLPDIVDAV
jgi:ABC-type polysaccharide/polyol phosphate export permease